MKKSTFSKPITVIVILLTILTISRLYINYKAADEVTNQTFRTDIKVINKNGFNIILPSKNSNVK